MVHPLFSYPCTAVCAGKSTGQVSHKDSLPPVLTLCRSVASSKRDTVITKTTTIMEVDGNTTGDDISNTTVKTGCLVEQQ